jgi:hypothetical protein
VTSAQELASITAPEVVAVFAQLLTLRGLLAGY